MPVNQAQS